MVQDTPITNFLKFIENKNHEETLRFICIISLFLIRL